MSARMYFSGVDVSLEISDDEFDRMKRAVEKSGNVTLQPFRNMASGAIINLAHVSAIIPGDVQDEKPVVYANQPVPTGVWVEPDGYDSADVDGCCIGTAPLITVDDLNAIIDAKKLKPADLVTALGYSSATVRMALKGDRISQEFSDKVRATYPEFFTQPEQDPQFHTADEG